MGPLEEELDRVPRQYSLKAGGRYLKLAGGVDVD